MSDPLPSVAGVDFSSAVSVAVARKAMDAAKSEGEAMVSLIRAAGSVGGRGASTSTVAAPGEPGARVDMTG